MTRWGLFGGTFDPIHAGHIRLADAVRNAAGLQRVLFMPTAQSPHKLKGGTASVEDRLAMCRLATLALDWAEVSDWEAQKGGVSFTVDTLAYLTGQYPDVEWYLIVGADAFLMLDTWLRFSEIAQMATICCAARGDVGKEDLCAAAARMQEKGARCIVADMEKADVSSTGIHQQIRVGESLAGAVCPKVEEYIMEHGLYQNDIVTSPSDEQIVQIIEARLTPKRFAHSLAVAVEAERLARRYGADPQKAKTAGLLHDIMKNTPPEDQLQILQKFGILLTEVEKSAEKLYHAMSGAVFCERVLEIKDKEIIDAVRYHTTARAGMSLLEKVLYLADFTSADRDYDDVDEMRRRVDIGILPAMEYALVYTICELTEKRKAIHPDTLAAYNDVMLQIQKGEA